MIQPLRTVVLVLLAATSNTSIAAPIPLGNKGANRSGHAVGGSSLVSRWFGVDSLFFQVERLKQATDRQLQTTTESNTTTVPGAPTVAPIEFNVTSVPNTNPPTLVPVTIAPTNFPTASPTPQIIVRDFEASFGNIFVLNTTELGVFETIVDRWFENYYNDDPNQVIRNVESSITVTNQNVRTGSNAKTISYDQALNYIENEGVNRAPEEYALEPYLDAENVENLLIELIETLPVQFGGTTTDDIGVVVTVIDRDSSTTGIASWLLATFILSAIMGIILMGGVVYRRRFLKRQREEPPDATRNHNEESHDADQRELLHAPTANLPRARQEPLDTLTENLPRAEVMRVLPDHSAHQVARRPEDLEFKDQVRGLEGEPRRATRRINAENLEFKDQVRAREDEPGTGNGEPRPGNGPSDYQYKDWPSMKSKYEC